MIRSAVFLGMLVAGPALAADCPEPKSTADLQDALDTAGTRYSALDLDGFKQSTDQARLILPCVSDPVPRHLAASMHRYQGLRWFIDREPTLSTKAFAAARSIEPKYTFPTTMVPEGNPVLKDYQAVSISSGTFETVVEPAAGRIQFDGRSKLDRPTAWPTVVQIFDDAGSVGTTAYLLPEDPMPAYEAKAAEPVATAADPEPTPTPDPTPDPITPDPSTETTTPTSGGKGTRNALLATAGVSALVSGGTYFLAWRANQRYYETDDFDQLDTLRSRNNTFVLLSGGTGAIAVGAAVGAAFTTRW